MCGKLLNCELFIFVILDADFWWLFSIFLVLYLFCIVFNLHTYIYIYIIVRFISKSVSWLFAKFVILVKWPVSRVKSVVVERRMLVVVIYIDFSRQLSRLNSRTGLLFCTLSIDFFQTFSSVSFARHLFALFITCPF